MFSKKNKFSYWSLELGVPHVLILLLIVSASLGISYYLGMITGTKIGFENSQEAQNYVIAKLPIVSEDIRKVDDSQEAVLASLDFSKLKDSFVDSELKEAEKNSREDKDAKNQIEPLGESKDLENVLAEKEIELAKNDKINIKPVVETIVKKIEQEIPEKEPVLIAKENLKVKEDKEEEIKKVKEIGVLPKGWFAQIAAPRAKSDAQNLQKRLKFSGLESHIEEAVVAGQTFYRVLVGPAASKDTAEKWASKLFSSGLSTGQPFLKNVR